MKKIKPTNCFTCALLLLGTPVCTDAYNIDIGAKWLSAQTTMYVNLAGNNGLWNSAFSEAAQQWQTTTGFQFTISPQYLDPCNRNDNLNGVDWRNDDCGDSFGDAIAVTHIVWNTRNRRLSQADMLFDDSRQWDIYHGRLKSISYFSNEVLYDFRRVALHELGHVLGLNHVPQDESSVMVPAISDVDSITQDDMNGVQALYGKIQTNQTPVANFVLTPAQGSNPLTVFLDASSAQDSDGTISSYFWASSDGQTASGQKNQFIFNQAATYTITLTVTDNTGASSSNTKTVNVTLNTPPTAKFIATIPNGAVPLTVTLDASASSDADGSIATYTWKSSDGQITTGKNAALTFTDSGKYTLTLTTTDDKGVATSLAQTIDIPIQAQLTESIPADYDLVSGTLTLADVTAFGQHFSVHMQNQGDFTFTLTDFKSLPLGTFAHPATYDDQLKLLTIPDVKVGSIHFSVNLTNTGAFNFKLQDFHQIL